MKIKQFLIAVCIGSMLAACSSEDATEQKVERVPIKFTASIQNLIPSVGTRVSEGASGMISNSFPVNSEIQVGYAIYGSSADAYITNSSGEWRYKDNVLYLPNDETELTIGAIYPPIEGSQIGGILTARYTYRTPDDQSSFANYKTADVIGALAKVSSLTTGPVDLSFKHLFTKIIVNLEGMPNLSGCSIKMTNISKIAYLTISGNNINNQNFPSSEGSTILGSYSSLGQSAIILPQKISANTDLFEVSNGGKTYKYTQISEITFKAGYVYTFNLKFDGTAITTGTISMSGWESDENYSTPIEGSLSEQTT